ncbi:MAG: type IV pili methyl-accepting chemotaxis transducer N-terminal domain-containing protein [Gammaproteobacteria bacterium]|nr:type IV pili methyl-accepting chemotaxis transducer N-terminal domain-containing protein [Gammaproteobacteria bacterium]MBU2184192.1 type IV pili methyl-accepting chemotaxis transducer N-terminal domain-containing protein [Gammaproteobacteria bacterium]MBU2206196.1 type IV pili methyl-accepting chemotaxis transducer N-terminal domain-containing protein [Gammaproteobacteria bacterium]
MRQFSIVSRINIALACIVTLAIGTMLASYWLSDKTDNDAHAVNVAGSLRMQSYRMAWLTQQQDQQKLQAAKAQFNQSWQHPVFTRFMHNDTIVAQFDAARQHWQQIEPQLTQLPQQPAQIEQALAEQIQLLEQLVSYIQQDAEQKVRSFRTLQLVALLATVLLSAIVIYWLKVMVQQPLEALTQGAKRVAMGDFTHRLSVENNDELGTLAHSFNKMNDSISYMYGNLEQRVEQQTEALKHSNTTLRFLYNTAQRISEHVPEYADFTKIVTELKTVVKVEDLELCLFTDAGDKPYMQLLPADDDSPPCVAISCGDCVSQPQTTGCNTRQYNYLLQREQKKYGVLVARIDPGQSLERWQQQLLTSVADQLALALSLKSEEQQVRRLALMQERTVIARELHDSLAQALSYLKIQVTRLNKATQKDDKAIIADVSAELKQGLDAAYRQLRELLTTFRLKVDGEGLLSALQTTVKQLSEQSDLQIRLDYQLTNVPLAPHEEIHLLQIIREASQNAVHHSQGSELKISLQHSREGISLAVEDNGVGIPDSAEKLNHYGLAIMQERSKHLGGQIQIKARTEGGTGVYFSFTPEYLLQQHMA